MLAARNNVNLDVQVPRSCMTEEMIDTSHICNFQWNKWVKICQIGSEDVYTSPIKYLGRCLGLARNQNNSVNRHFLPENDKVIPIQTLRCLTEAEKDSPLEQSTR